MTPLSFIQSISKICWHNLWDIQNMTSASTLWSGLPSSYTWIITSTFKPSSLLPPHQPLTPDCSHHIQWAFNHWSQVTPCPAQRPAGAPVSEANHGPRDGPQCVVCPPLLPSPRSPFPPTLPVTHSSPATRVSLLPLNTPDTTFPLLVLRYLGILLSFFLPVSTERSPHQWSFPDRPI